jgi:biopolymer transport protein ExbB
MRLRRLFPFLLLWLVYAAPLPAQGIPADSPVPAAPAPIKDRTLLDLYRTGGFVMHPLAAASVAMVAIAVYLQLTLARAKLMPSEELAAFSAFLGRRELDAAARYARERPSLLARALSAALVKADFNRDLFNRPAMEAAASDAHNHEEGKLMAWVHYLNVISTLAPMLGLLGTVTGMIASFEQLQGGRATPTDLAGGIGEAMIATATGLLLAIPAMFFFFHYRNLLSLSVSEVGQRTGRLLDLFTGEATAEGHRPDAPHDPAS